MATITANTKDLSLPESNLKDYWDIIVRRRWIVVSFCLIATFVVGVISFLKTPLYRATATIVVEGEDADVLNATPNSSKGVSFDIFENYVQTQMSLVLSRNVAGKIFEELGLASTPRYQEKQGRFSSLFNVQVSPTLSSEQTPKPSGDPLQLFLQDIELERVKGTRAIKISVFNPDPVMAAKISNGLANRYVQDNMTRRALTYIRNQRMATLNSEFLRLQSKYDTLSNQYGPMHHEMVALKNEIRAMARRIENERQRHQEAVIAPDPFLNTPPEQKVEEERLLEDILLRIQESSVLSSSQMNNIVVADPASVPTRVAKPNKKMNVLIAFAGGLVAGIFLAFFVDYLDDTVKSETDVKRVTRGVPFLGTVPLDRHARGFHKSDQIDQLFVHRPLSEAAESYRLLRMQIHWFAKKRTNFKDFAMTSSTPDEGKTTISSNIAISLAQLDKRILLVDADIRRGRLHKTYATKKNRGLRQYLTEDIAIEEIIQKTTIPNLSVVTPGENVIMGSELLVSPKMSDFILQVRQMFDLVIYDTAPITLISDTSVLISQLHGVIFVCRAGLTRTRIIPKALSMIDNVNTKLIGVVLNSTSSTESKYHNRYYTN